MGWETLAGKTEFIHTQTVLIFNKKVGEGRKEAPVSIPKEVESVHGQWLHWTGATPTKAQRAIKACFKFSDGRAEPSAPHPADERAAGSHAHPGGRLLAFLLHRARFQVQHSPCGGKDKRCVSDGRLQALGPTGRAGRPPDALWTCVVVLCRRELLPQLLPVVQVQLIVEGGAEPIGLRLVEDGRHRVRDVNDTSSFA